MSDAIKWAISPEAVRAGARILNRELGCQGAHTDVECARIEDDGNCECARIASLIIGAALSSQFNDGQSSNETS